MNNEGSYPFITLEGKQSNLTALFIPLASAADLPAKQKSFGIQVDGYRDIFIEFPLLAFCLRM